MVASVEVVISPEEEHALHERLLAGEVTAPAELANKYFNALVAWLVAHNAAAEDLCAEAAETAWLALVKNPASFNPARGKRLGAYLRMSAQGDLRNLLRREGRHRRQISLHAVELSPDAGKYLTVNDDPLLRLELEEESARATKVVVEPARDNLTEADSRALDLLLQGQHKTAVFAQALGIAHLPANEQRAQVKRVKDKLKRRMQRQANRDGQSS